MSERGPMPSGQSGSVCHYLEDPGWCRCLDDHDPEETCNPDEEVISLSQPDTFSTTSTHHSTSSALPERAENRLWWFQDANDTQCRSGKLDGQKRYLSRW